MIDLKPLIRFIVKDYASPGTARMASAIRHVFSKTGCDWLTPRVPRWKSSNCSPYSTIRDESTKATTTATGSVVLILPPSYAATCSTFPMPTLHFSMKPVPATPMETLTPTLPSKRAGTATASILVASA